MARFGMTMFRRRPATTLSELVATMPERELQNEVAQLAKVNHWMAYHTWRSDHSAAGFPDLVLLRGERLIFAELKAKGNVPTEAQMGWLIALQATKKVETYLWYPYDRDEIERILR